MIKNKRERKNLQQNRMRSQSEDLYSNSDFEEEMKCNETLEELNYFTANFQQDEQNDDKCTCRCTKCQGYIIKTQTKDLEGDEKKKLKRRQYKKRQKLKTQQKKQQALKELSDIIVEIYALKTDSERQRTKIQQCLRTIQKNENRFYEFINAVIRQQVETIKRQMRICLSQLASESPNFSKVPRLYEQFMKVKDASPQVEIIINFFIKIISEKNQEPPRYHRDLDKKTFKFLLISDVQNRNNFLKVIKIIEEGNIIYEREKQMLRMMVEMIKQKNITSECSSSDQNSERDYSQNDDDFDQESEYYTVQNTTKSSQRQEQENYFDEEAGEYDENEKENRELHRRNLKRRRKNKNLKIYEASYEKTYETLVLLGKTLSNKKQGKLPCNLEEQWISKFREKFLKSAQPTNSSKNQSPNRKQRSAKQQSLLKKESPLKVQVSAKKRL